MQSQAKMASAMGSTAKAMAATNKQLKVEDIQKTMMNFEKESTKMDLAGEMSKPACVMCHDAFSTRYTCAPLGLIVLAVAIHLN